MLLLGVFCLILLAKISANHCQNTYIENLSSSNFSMRYEKNGCPQDWFKFKNFCTVTLVNKGEIKLKCIVVKGQRGEEGENVVYIGERGELVYFIIQYIYINVCVMKENEIISILCWKIWEKMTFFRLKIGFSKRI